MMQKKAMVVDSDYFFVEFLSELLSKRGYAVLKAYDGKEGIALLENDTVDVLFSDLALPKVDSRRFFQFIRDKYNGYNIPIVAISGIMIEQLGARIGINLAGWWSDHRACTVADGEEPLVLQQPIRPGNRVQVDPEIPRKSTYRGQGRPWSKSTR